MITVDDIDELAMPRAELYAMASDTGAGESDEDAVRRVNKGIFYAVNKVTTAITNAGYKPEDVSDNAEIKVAACDIAVYRVAARRGAVTEEVRTKYKAAVDYLIDLVNKAIRPDGSNTADEEAIFTVQTREPSLINRLDSMP